MVRWFEHHQVYCPSRTMEASPTNLACPFEDLSLTASDGVQLHGWFFPPAKKKARSQLVFLLLHGNAVNICHRLDFCRAWLELGLNVFLFDYLGSGQSQGAPTGEGQHLVAQPAYPW